MERRFLDNLSIKGKKICGYAVVANAESQDLGGFVEKIAPYAFSKYLSRDGVDVKALYEHDRKLILGRTTSNTLKIHEDKNGLYVEIIPPDTQVANDLLVSIERGDITGMSFGFIAIKDDWNYSVEPAVRTVLEAELLEVTITSDPAYLATDVKVAQRSFKERKQSLNANLLAELDLLEVI